MNKVRKIRVGASFKLTCGIFVTIIEINKQRAKVIDSEGNVKDVCVSALVDGNVSWIWHNLGKIYKLKCGTEVTIVSYIGSSVWEVRDSKGNSKNCRLDRLKAGSLSWDWEKDVRKNKPRLPCLGQVFTLKCGVEITVIEEYGSGKVKVKDSENNTKMTSIGAVKQGVVGWGEFKEDYWDYLRPTKNRYYVYLVSYKNEIVYIGKGKGNRYTHANSGASSSKELNRLYFLGEKVTVSLYKDDLSNEESLQIEEQLIKEIKPKFNTVFKN